MKFKGRVDYLTKVVKQVSSGLMSASSIMTAMVLNSGNTCTSFSYSPFLLVFDGYIIIIFYKNASGDGSASPNAEAVKLSEEL